jgi:hypothetical protein
MLEMFSISIGLSSKLINLSLARWEGKRGLCEISHGWPGFGFSYSFFSMTITTNN